MVKCCVLFEVRTEFLNIAEMSYVFKGLKAPYESFSLYSFSLIGLFTSAFPPQTLHKLSTYQLCHYSPEDGNSMFLRNVGIDLRNQTASKPKTTLTS
jgi:hypothetical protein